MAFTTTEAYLVNLFITCILYGIYLPMFIDSLRVLIPSSTAIRTGTPVKRTLVVVAISIFILETASLVLNLLRCFDHFIYEPKGRAKIVGIGISVTYLTLPLGDGILLYRCFIVWNRRWSVIAIPFLLWVTSAASYIGGIVNEVVKDGGGVITNTAVIVIVDAMAITSFVLNACLTALISYRVWSVGRYRKHESVTVVGGRTLGGVQRMVIECGLLWTTTLAILLATSLSKSTAAVLATGAAKHVSGIAFSLMILRVGWRGRNEVTSPSTRGSTQRNTIVFSPPIEVDSYALSSHTKVPSPSHDKDDISSSVV